jgi:hypothetical protein
LGISKDELAKLHAIPASQLVAAAFAAQAKVAPFAFPKLGAEGNEEPPPDTTTPWRRP